MNRKSISTDVQDRATTSESVIAQYSDDSESGSGGVEFSGVTDSKKILRPKRGLPDNMRDPQDSAIPEASSFTTSSSIC